MSNVLVTDQRGGIFQVEATFTYGECDRLPYNSLRKVKAKIEQVSHGGIKATAIFNLRDKQDAEYFVEMLDLFGEDGSFVHGSSADPNRLQIVAPPREEDSESAIRAAAATTSSKKESAVANSGPASPKAEENFGSFLPDDNEDDGMDIEEDASAELEVEEEEEVLIEEEPLGEDWKMAGDDAVAVSVQKKEDRPATLKRVISAAGDKYSLNMIREGMIKLLADQYSDPKKIASIMRDRGWKEVTVETVAKYK